MAVYLRIDFDEFVEMAEQLPEEQQKQLILRLLMQRSRQRPLNLEEKMQLREATQLAHAGGSK
jgi:hypothetical protein